MQLEEVLAHHVGDIHQPLHVAAVYLVANADTGLTAPTISNLHTFRRTVAPLACTGVEPQHAIDVLGKDVPMAIAIPVCYASKAVAVPSVTNLHTLAVL